MNDVKDEYRPRQSIRPSSAEIDERILDLTAGLLAKHGVKAMSVSMVAEASGYSKAAVFRRFKDKEHLVDAALRRCADLGKQVLLAVDGIPAGHERGRTALRAMLDLAFLWPGFIALALASIAIRERDEFDGRLGELGNALLAAFSIPTLENRTDAAPLFRALGALSALSVLTLVYSRYTDSETARGLILDTSEAALYGEPPTALFDP